MLVTELTASSRNSASSFIMHGPLSPRCSTSAAPGSEVRMRAIGGTGIQLAELEQNLLHQCAEVRRIAIEWAHGSACQIDRKSNDASLEEFGRESKRTFRGSPESRTIPQALFPMPRREPGGNDALRLAAARSLFQLDRELVCPALDLEREGARFQVPVFFRDIRVLLHRRRSTRGRLRQRRCHGHLVDSRLQRRRESVFPEPSIVATCRRLFLSSRNSRPFRDRLTLKGHISRDTPAGPAGPQPSRAANPSQHQPARPHAGDSVELTPTYRIPPLQAGERRAPGPE